MDAKCLYLCLCICVRVYDYVFDVVSERDRDCFIFSCFWSSIRWHAEQFPVAGTIKYCASTSTFDFTKILWHANDGYIIIIIIVIHVYVCMYIYMKLLNRQTWMGIVIYFIWISKVLDIYIYKCVTVHVCVWIATVVWQIVHARATTSLVHTYIYYIKYISRVETPFNLLLECCFCWSEYQWSDLFKFDACIYQFFFIERERERARKCEASQIYF